MKQYCDTSEVVIDKMVEKLQPYNFFTNMSVLEPQAGSGAIIKRLPINKFNNNVCFCEINQKKASKVLEETGAQFLDWDFLKLSEKIKFDLIISVPPFDSEQWLSHTTKMYEHLKKNGKMVVLLPVEAIKHGEFMDWVISLHGTIEFIKECACDYICQTFILEIVKS